MPEKNSPPPEESSNKRSPLTRRIAVAVLIVFLTLFPVIFVSSSYVGISYLKMGLLSLAVLVSAILFLIESIYKGEISLPPPALLLAWIAVPLFVTVSALLSLNPDSGLMGRGIQYDTAYFVVFGFSLMALFAVYFQEKQKIFFSYLAFLSVFALVALFHFLRILLGAQFLSFGFFSGIAVNTIGTWNDLGIYAGIAVILSFITIEMINLGRLPKALLYVVLGAGLILVTITNFYVIFDLYGLLVPLSAIIGFISLISFLYAVSLNYAVKRKAAEDKEAAGVPKRSSKFKMPLPSLLVLVVTVIVTIWASPISSAFYAYSKVSLSEVTNVSPTVSGSSYVTSKVLALGVRPALFGIGPSRFFAAWSTFRPAGVNETDLWNADFSYGAGYILTSLITTGILGFLAWLSFIGCLFYFISKIIFSGIKDKFSLYLIISSSLVAAYLWFIAIFNVPSLSIIVFTFVFSGLCIASLVREGTVPTKRIVWSNDHKKGFLCLFIIVALIISIVVCVSVWADRFIASVYASRAIASIGANNTATGEALLSSAINKDPADTYLDLFSQLKLLELQRDMNKGVSTPPQLSSGDVTLYNDAVTAALQAARSADPYNYQNWVFLGSVYQLGASLGVDQTAAGLARDSYVIAAQLAPSSPLPPFLSGRLYALAGNNEQARAYFKAALALKTNFTEAQTALNQLSQAGSAPAASASSTAAASTSSSSKASSKNSH